MLSHRLARADIENTVLEQRGHETIRTTHRAGILEPGAVRMLSETGFGGRVGARYTSAAEWKLLLDA